MGEIQILAFLIVPAVAALIGYLMVIYHEHARHRQGDANDLTYANMLLRFPFQAAQGGLKYNAVIMGLAFVYKFSLGAFVFAIIANDLSQPWSDIIAAFGGLVTALLATIVPTVPA